MNEKRNSAKLWSTISIHTYQPYFYRLAMDNLKEGKKTIQVIVA